MEIKYRLQLRVKHRCVYIIRSPDHFPRRYFLLLLPPRGRELIQDSKTSTQQGSQQFTPISFRIIEPRKVTSPRRGEYRRIRYRKKEEEEEGGGFLELFLSRGEIIMKACRWSSGVFCRRVYAELATFPRKVAVNTLKCDPLDM